MEAETHTFILILAGCVHSKWLNCCFHKKRIDVFQQHFVQSSLHLFQTTTNLDPNAQLSGKQQVCVIKTDQGIEMLSAQSKIKKRDGEKIDEIENSVCQALFELEMTSENKNQLRELQIVGVKEYSVKGKKALAIFIPPPQLKAWQKLQTRLVRELEKKFSGKHVVFVAKRTILPKPSRKSRINKQKRPINRTLTSVHDAYLADLVYPAEIVGKRTRVRLDGSTLIKVHLDKTSQTSIEHKVGLVCYAV